MKKFLWSAILMIVSCRSMTGDSVVGFSTFLGGNGLDDGRAVAVDAQGNVYVAGTTRSPNFPATSDAAKSSYNTGQFPGDVFVTKFDRDGATVRYSTFLGGSRSDVATSIAVDAAGTIYIAGYTDSLDFPVTPGSFQTSNLSSGGYPEGFLTKLSPQGSVIYSTYLGRSASDRIHAIAVDASGNAFVAGASDSPDFPTTASAFNPGPCSRGGLHPFVSKLNSDATSLVYSTLLCSSANDEALAIAVDRDGNAYVAGATSAGDFPTTAGAVRRQPGGDGNEAFIAKLNSGGTALLYSTYLGGTAADVATGVAVDSQGNAYVTGYTRSTDFPTTAAPVQSRHADRGLFEDAFIALVNSTGTSLLHSTYLGGQANDRASAIALDTTGAVYVAGSTTSRDFPGPRGACQPGALGRQDAFVTKLSLSPPRIAYSSLLSGFEDDRGQAVAVDQNGNAYIAGQTLSRNFATTPGAFRTAYASGYAGASDSFVARVEDRSAASTPCVALNGIVSAASFLPSSLSPGQIVSVFGQELGPVQPAVFTLNPAGIVDTTLAGTRVLFDSVSAPVIMSSALQVNVIVPYEVAGKQTVRVRVEYQGRSTPEIVVPVTAAQPSIFTQNSTARGPGAILNQDYSLNTPANAAAKGSIIQIFGSGEGQTSPAGVNGRINLSTLPKPQLEVAVLIGGRPAPVLYAGAAPGLVAGVIQVNAQVPQDAPSGGAVPVTLRIGESTSPSGVTVAVR